jgi:hypothetical protein
MRCVRERVIVLIPTVAGHLDFVRSLLKEEDYVKATLAANLFFCG